MKELALTLNCEGAELSAILHDPENGARTGVLVVVGGPQYRIGSHRSFVLLARHLCGAGWPVLRFDYRGMGDSEGKLAGFEEIDQDIASAAALMFERLPDLNSLVIYGLCDAASAALLYSARDPRVGGLVLLNPWVRTETSHATAMVRHYYGAKFLDRKFWRKVVTGQVALGDSVRGLLDNLSGSVRRAPAADAAQQPFPERMREALEKFDGETLLVLSGQDLTADEFRDLTRKDPRWSRLVAATSVSCFQLPDATHTFSSAHWRDQVAREIQSWLTRHFASPDTDKVGSESGTGMNS